MLIFSFEQTEGHRHRCRRRRRRHRRRRHPIQEDPKIEQLFVLGRCSHSE